MEFEEAVRRALDSLPPGLAAELRNVAVVIEDENEDDPDLYGLFDGIPRTEALDAAGALPGKISIYRLPLEDDFPDPEKLVHEIRVTVLHEIGHYFGLDEDRLEQLGYE